MVEIPNKCFTQSSVGLSTKNAWARYVRNRWRTNTLCEIQSEWDLTEGQARGLLYAQASQSTIDAILEHPRGGFGLGLLILEIKTQTTLESYITAQAEKARHEAAEWQSEQRRLAILQARLTGVCSLVGSPSQQAWSSGSEDARLGSSEDVEGRSFDPEGRP